VDASDPAAGGRGRRRALWILAVLLPLAFAARVFNSNDGFAGDAEVLIARNDASYHARRALYTFENFPRILWFDSYLAYPDGAAVPVPPLYDWSLAAVARAFASTQRGFERVVAWSPPLLGALTLLPVFFTGRRLGGPRVGLLAAGILALLPLHAEFARLGNADHHAIVALIAACWLALIVREALGEERRRAAAIALRAAVMATMLLTWSGSLLLLALAEGSALAAWVVLGRAHLLRNQAFAAATAAALVAPWVAVAPTPVGGPFSSTTLSWLHPLVLLGLPCMRPPKGTPSANTSAPCTSRANRGCSWSVGWRISRASPANRASRSSWPSSRCFSTKIPGTIPCQTCTRWWATRPGAGALR